MDRQVAFVVLHASTVKSAGIRGHGRLGRLISCALPRRPAPTHVRSPPEKQAINPYLRVGRDDFGPNRRGTVVLARAHVGERAIAVVFSVSRRSIRPVAASISAVRTCAFTATCVSSFHRK